MAIDPMVLNPKVLTDDLPELILNLIENMGMNNTEDEILNLLNDLIGSHNMTSLKSIDDIINMYVHNGDIYILLVYV